VSSVEFLDVERHVSDNGSLSVFQEGSLPFAVKRAFVIEAEPNDLRGGHAHKECAQFFTVLRGSVRVGVVDELGPRSLDVVAGGPGLLIPPLCWAEQTYLETQTIALVLCDRTFDEADYIREFEMFRRLRDAFHLD